MATQQEAVHAAAVPALRLLLFLLLCGACWSTSAASPAPVSICAGSREPVVLAEALPFCGGDAGVSCCDADDDAGLRAQFDGLRISDTTCAARVKNFLCSKCVPSLSAMLFNLVDSATTMEFTVPLLCGSIPSWTPAQSETPPPTTRLPWEQDTLCLERISAGSYSTMAAHPDGSSRIFLTSREGKIWLASMPGFGGALHVDSPFLDITDRVHHDEVLGLVGLAFHPGFMTNGRFFVSYNCGSRTSPVCGEGRCWGSAAGNGPHSCRYQLVVSEFSAKGSTYKATGTYPSEVRRIFTMGLPHPHTSYSYQRHGGQILFQPSHSDGYLYLITGNGDLSKNGRSFFGKILRFYVGGMPGENRWTSDHATPKMDMPEIFAMGLDNPSGCSFDTNRPSYLYCTDVNEKRYELVYLITRGRNYSGSSKVIVSSIINHGRPADGRMPSIVGGLMYRGSADPLLKGRYLYIYASSVWAGVDALDSRSNGHHASAQVPIVRCSRRSPVPCNGIGITGRVLSLGEDSSKDAFILATGGVFRVVPPSLCSDTQLLQPARGADWVLSVLGFALLFAFYLVWTTIFGGGGKVGRCCNGCFRKISISCCNWPRPKRSAYNRNRRAGGRRQ